MTVTVQRLSMPRFTRSNTGKPIIDTLIDQLGGFGIHGAYVLTGGQQLVYKGDDLPGTTSHVDDMGFVHYETGVMWRVNAGRRLWKMIVNLEPDDTYTVRLYRVHRTPKKTKAGGYSVGEVLFESQGVYCDNLIDIVDHLYVQGVNKHMQGFIPI